MKDLSRILFLLYIGLSMLVVFYCLIFTCKTNHSSFDFTKIFLCYGGFGIILGVFFWIFTKSNRILLEFVVAWIVIVLLGVLFNIFNVMISYDLWLERNMPNKFIFKL